MSGIGIGISPMILRKGGYTAIMQNYLTRLASEGGSLTNAEKGYLNTLTLNADILEFDRLWIHGLSNQIAARISLVNALTASLITEVNSPTWTSGQGYQGNGTTSYLDTNYNPSTQGVKYTQNSATGLAYCINSVGATVSNVFASFDLVNISTSLYLNYTALGLVSYANSNSADFINDASITSTLGLFSSVRTNSTTVSQYRNGTLSTSGVKTSQTIPNLTLFLGGSNLNGIVTNPSTNKMAVTGFGSGAIDQAQFYTDVQALGTSLGWAV